MYRGLVAASNCPSVAAIGAFCASLDSVQIDKIVVGTDFSPAADVAVAQAIRIARHVGAEVVLVHIGAVAERLEETPQFGSYDRQIREWMTQQFADHRAQLGQLRDRLVGQGVTVSQAIHEGAPADALVKVARELAADLVIVGSHGHTGIKRFLLGSIAESVVRLSEETVLVARGASGSGGFRRILVPVAFDDWSDEAINTAALLAADDARIEFFHCWHLPPGLVDSWGAGQSSAIAEVRQAMTQRANDKLNQLVSQHQLPNINLSYQQVESPARYGIAKRLDGGNYDLVVVGSHGRRGAKRWLVGSVAEATCRHAACPVVVVKGHRPTESAASPR